MKNMKIRTRLSMGFAFVLILMVAVAGTGMWGLMSVQHASDEVAAKTAIQKDAFNWVGYTRTNGARLLAYALSTNAQDETYLNRVMNEMSQQVSETQKRILEYPKLVASDRATLEQIAKLREIYVGIRSEMVKFKNEGTTEGRDKARAIAYEKMIPARDEYIQALEKFADGIDAQVQELIVGVDITYKFASLALGILAAVAVFAGIVFAFTLTIGITRPLNRAVQVAQTVASGDLTSVIEVTSRDETGMLMQTLRDMNESLYRAISQVRNSAEAIATASAEIASGNQDLSARTEQQASSLEETASSMEELTSTVRQNGDNARQANQFSANAAGMATKGGESSAQVERMMDEINQSSTKIVDIISVIDGIAFQTNILALNAAVEAARAGEQGRGFAVVATEVRNLAQRSADAAREIKTLIDDSVSKVEAGTQYVNEASENMREIVEGIQRVNDIMTEISSATQEQVQGIEQVNRAVTEMDTVSQQNAALVEQATAAAESLQDQARTLVEVASQFRLGRDGHPGRGAVSAVRAAPAVKPAVAQRRPAAAFKPAPAKQGLAAPPRDIKPVAADDADWEEF